MTRQQPLARTREALAQTGDRAKEAAGPPREPLATTPQVAAYLGVPEQTVYGWRAAGKDCPPAIRVGKYLRWRWSDIDAWLDRQQRLGGAA